jgi:hypothetical protein
LPTLNSVIHQSSNPVTSRHAESPSGEDFLDDAGGFDAGEALVKALELKREAFVIDAQQVEDGGVEVADVHGVADDVAGIRVGLKRIGTDRDRYKNVFE